MNTYIKYCPNVYLAKCQEKYERGENIFVTTQYGKENECIVHNFICMSRDGAYCYSVVRADGFDAQTRAERKVEKLLNAAHNSKRKSDNYYNRSNKDSDFLSLGEPVKVGHHSESKHRRIIEQAQNNMSKSVEMQRKSGAYEARAAYWEKKQEEINLSMPESIEYFKFALDAARGKHEGLKNGTIEKRHSYSLPYAKKEVNELTKKLEIAKKLWAVE